METQNLQKVKLNPQKTRQMKPVTNFLIKAILLFLVISTACSVSEIPKETNTILKAAIKNHNKKSLLSISLVDSLDLPKTLTIDLFDKLVFGNVLSSEGDSIITKNDINSWNKKISGYKPRRLSKDHISGIPVYDTENEELINTKAELSDFDIVVEVSKPFLNSSSDKALMYYVLCIFSRSWRTYKKLISYGF